MTAARVLAWTAVGLVGGMLLADGVRRFREAAPAPIEPVFPPAAAVIDDADMADMLAGAALATRHEVGRELVIDGPGERIEPVFTGRGMSWRRVPVALVSIAVRSMAALFVVASFLRPVALITPTWGGVRARCVELCAEITARARVLWAETWPAVGGFSWVSVRRICAPVSGTDWSAFSRPFPGVVIAT
jgi:hypothetical protein